MLPFEIAHDAVAPSDDIAPIENLPLRMQVANRLREAIVSGRLRPGAPLVETALAQQLNISRAPIREAIQILENDGLVETIAYKGKRVKPLTAREVEEIYSLRQVFEAMAVRRIMAKGVSVAPLHAICATMTRAAEAGNFDAVIAADEEFHRTLIRLADHDLLLATWGNLYLKIHQIMSLRGGNHRALPEIAANHPPIVAAIESGNEDEAVRLIAEHTRSLEDIKPELIAGSPD